MSTAAARLDDDVNVLMRSVTSSLTTSTRATSSDVDDDDEYVNDADTTRPPPALYAQVHTAFDAGGLYKTFCSHSEPGCRVE